MQGRVNHAGITVKASGPVVKEVMTGTDGLFSIPNLPPGDYIVTASHLKYLSRQDNSVQCQANQTTTLGHTTLLGGDTDNNKAVNLFDLVTVGAAYNTCVGDMDFNPAADINDTGCVDIFDLVMVGINYGMTGPVPWDAVFTTSVTSAEGEGMPAPAIREPGASLNTDAERFDLRVENMHDLYGLDVTLTFDASEVNVIDADSEKPGVQTEIGPLFAGQQYFNPVNQVVIDEETGIGTIEFVVGLIGAEPIDGAGIVATVLFESADSQTVSASSAFNIDEALLVDQHRRQMLIEMEGATMRQIFRIHLPFTAR
jgi:hypothetical protein